MHYALLLYSHQYREIGMPRVNIYVRVADMEKFKAIKELPKWLHAAIKHADDLEAERKPELTTSGN